jgi:hypothetical protein
MANTTEQQHLAISHEPPASLQIVRVVHHAAVTSVCTQYHILMTCCTHNSAGRGYSAQLGPGAGSLGGTGASHSGTGSFSYTSATAVPGACYGNVTALLAGSGGGNSTSSSSSSSSSTTGGAGGGVLVLTAALLQLATGVRLSVDGRPGGAAGAGGGSGGSISIETGALTGTGSSSSTEVIV